MSLKYLFGIGVSNLLGDVIITLSTKTTTLSISLNQHQEFCITPFLVKDKIIKDITGIFTSGFLSSGSAMNSFSSQSSG